MAFGKVEEEKRILFLFDQKGESYIRIYHILWVCGVHWKKKISLGKTFSCHVVIERACITAWEKTKKAKTLLHIYRITGGHKVPSPVAFKKNEKNIILKEKFFFLVNIKKQFCHNADLCQCISSKLKFHLSSPNKISFNSLNLGFTSKWPNRLGVPSISFRDRVSICTQAMKPVKPDKKQGGPKWRTLP